MIFEVGKMVDEDLRNMIDRMDHPYVFKKLESVGAFRPGAERSGPPLTRKIILELVGEEDFPRFFDNQRWLTELNTLLRHPTPKVVQSTPDVVPVTSPPKAVRTLPSLPHPDLDVIDAPPAGRAEKVPISTLIEAIEGRHRQIDQDDANVLTTERIEINPSSRSNDLADERMELPIVAPILLYLLVCLGTTGSLMSLNAPFIISFAFGLVFSCFVPALMPPHRIHTQLAGLSAFGWVLVFLAGLLSLPVSDAPVVMQNLTDGGLTSLYICINFMLLSAGVAAFGVIQEKQEWTRRMANTLSILALVLLSLCLLFPSMIEALVSVLGAMTGLWGVIVLGDARPIEIKKPIHQFAIISLGTAFISMFSAWEGNVFVFLIFCVILCGLALLAPNLPRTEASNALLATSASGFILLSMSLTSEWGISIIIHILILLMVLAQMELRYRVTNRSETRVYRFLSPDVSIPSQSLHRMNSDVAVLGFREAGKTSYLGALWLILSHHVIQDLWYGSAKYLNDDRPLGFSTQDLRDILDEGSSVHTRDLLLASDDPKEVLRKYLQHRGAKATMTTEFTLGQLPNPIHGFPFVPQAERPTRRFLEQFTKNLIIRDRMSRDVPDSTSAVSENLTMKLTFGAELNESYPTFFGLKTKQRRFTSRVQNQIQSFDVPGEEVQRAVEFLDGKNITSRSIQSLLNSIETHEEFSKQKEAIRYVVRMIAEYEHVIFVIDADKFTSIDRTGDSPVGAFLLLANKLAHLHGAALKRITLLLNKADTLIKRDEISNRSMPNGGLDSWADMPNRDLAMETVKEVIGPAIINSVQVPIEAYFACTFGGLINRGGDGENKEDDIPSFPMVPINVVEPLLRAMLVPLDQTEGYSFLGGGADD